MEKIAAFAERLGKIGALVVGLAYVVGFLTVSLDLGSYGLTPVELAKASYLAVGFFELLFLVALTSLGFFLMVSMFSVRDTSSKSETPRLSLPPLLSLPYSTLFLGLSLLVLASYVWFVRLAGTQWSASASLFAVVLILTSFAWDPHPEKEQPRPISWILRGGPYLLFLFLVISGTVYAGRQGIESVFSYLILCGFVVGTLFLLLVPFKPSANGDRFLWLRVGVFALLLLGFVLLSYIVYVHPRTSPPFGGRKPFVALIVEGPIELPPGTGIAIDPMPSGTRIGPAYVVLEKPDSIVLSQFPWICPEARSALEQGKACPYVEIPRSRIRQRWWVSRSEDKKQVCR